MPPGNASACMCCALAGLGLLFAGPAGADEMPRRIPATMGRFVLRSLQETSGEGGLVASATGRFDVRGGVVLRLENGTPVRRARSAPQCPSRDDLGLSVTLTVSDQEVPVDCDDTNGGERVELGGGVCGVLRARRDHAAHEAGYAYALAWSDDLVWYFLKVGVDAQRVARMRRELIAAAREVVANRNRRLPGARVRAALARGELEQQAESGGCRY